MVLTTWSELEELKKLIERKKSEEAVADTEPPPPTPGSVRARLRGQITMYTRQLEIERHEHIRRLDTIATELVAIQDELIKALEARLEEVEVKNQNLLNDLSDAHTEMETLKLDRHITSEMAPIQMID